MTTSTIENEENEVEISPTEDLMREHGILHRILLIYRDALKYLKGQKINSHVNIYLGIYNLSQFTQTEISLTM